MMWTRSTRKVACCLPMTQAMRSKSIPAVEERERGAIELCSRSSVALEEDLYENIHDLVDALCPLQTMSKGHENLMATIKNSVSQDRDSGACWIQFSVRCSLFWITAHNAALMPKHLVRFLAERQLVVEECAHCGPSSSIPLTSLIIFKVLPVH